ncbi:hypothetical protein I2W78_29935 [Streptomyces spinoverrucosus]|uniref:hypothetical protein n=1 Tax=Streptomyces spinoverrucosus TaxID=284043 RepID=UPI0018C38073|nr:hypothetical protein [Streptomyces spinoverrucosus]MBG0855951.1 hypothetical protein [Streptomyces spinoverrucosus]
MNTERPDNDDDVAGGTGAQASRRGSEDARASEEAHASGDAPASGTAEEGADQDTAGEEQGADQDATLHAPDAEQDATPDESGADQDTAREDQRAEQDATLHEPGADQTATLHEPGADQDAAHHAPGADQDAAHHERDADQDAAHPEPGADHDVTREEPGQGDAVRPARRRSPAVIASVAAAVLLVGGGGAYLAASAGGGSGSGTGSGAPAGNGTPPPLALDGYSSGTPNGIAPGEPDPNGVTYKADGTLPDGPRSAAVHWPKGEVTQEDVARLAEALDLAGTPVAEGQAWKIGGQDGQGPSLQVNRQAPGTWTFHRYAPGTDNCQGTTTCAKGPSAGSVDPVSEEAARKAAAPILKAVGQDSAKVDAGQVMGAQRVVNADPVVGGLPTYGWPTGVTVGAQGDVVAASGQLTAPVKGATYPVLSAERTLELMNAAQGPAPRAGIGGCASPVPLEGDASCGAATGAPKQERIAVEEAVFGLASHSVDARPALVPSWLFEVRAPGAQDSFTVTYPAIDPKYLASTQSGGQVSPRPSEPGDAPRARDVQVEGYTAEGRELTVSFTGGVCADYEAKAVEGSDKVTVTVTEKPWPDKVCILIAKVHYRTVQLDEPLGDRKVVGSDGKGVPLEKPGARLPQ